MNIYIACLASYNAGILHGEWLDISGFNESELQSKINKILQSSPIENSEEWAVHDYDSYDYDLGEYPSIESLITIVNHIEDYSKDVVKELYTEYESNLQTGDFIVYDCWSDIIDSWLDSFDIPEAIKYHIDYESIQNTLELEGIFLETDNGSIIEVL